MHACMHVRSIYSIASSVQFMIRKNACLLLKNLHSGRLVAKVWACMKQGHFHFFICDEKVLWRTVKDQQPPDTCTSGANIPSQQNGTIIWSRPKATAILAGLGTFIYAQYPSKLSCTQPMLHLRVVDHTAGKQYLLSCMQAHMAAGCQYVQAIPTPCIVVCMYHTSRW